MLKELVQFTDSVLNYPAFRNLNLTPKEGLHLVLTVENPSDQAPSIADAPAFVGHFQAKKTNLEEWFSKCASWAQVAWMTNTNKCFDLPAKAIHSCSPFCFAMKRVNLDALTDAAEWHRRITGYFTKAVALLEDEEHKKVADAFRLVLNDRNRLDAWLTGCEAFKAVKEGDYVVVYLDLPLETYAVANRKYLKEKLFNTAEYNVPDAGNPEVLHGTSSWLNGFPTKKPFLLHQSATFDISGRISLEEAQRLFDFSDLSRRKLFPNPLPLFIMADEQEKAFKIFKDDAAKGDDTRKGYLEVIEELSGPEMRDEVGNYYLLFRNPLGEIWDFDFVSRFEFYLERDRSAWEVVDLFNTKESMSLVTVRDLMNRVLPPMFNNALVVRRKDKDWIYHWFDEIDPAYTKTHNAFLMAVKYRKAFYDFIYKSQRQSVTGRAIEEILVTGILDDMQKDEYKKPLGFTRPINTEERNICTKLNLLFSLRQYFKPHNSLFMPATIKELVQRVNDVAAGKTHLETDEHFAFAAGQVLARIFFQNESANRTYKILDPYFRFSEVDKFKETLQEFFLRYAHKGYSARFEKVSSEVLSFNLDKDLKSIRPLILAGVFYREYVRQGDKIYKKTLLHAEKEITEAESEGAVSGL
ncbi:MAG TPA: hypothetical protein PK971_03295 [Saprospiraceae bacterium]|nr:hypothetical protein [Saprospiraceae bacterium]